MGKPKPERHTGGHLYHHCNRHLRLCQPVGATDLGCAISRSLQNVKGREARFSVAFALGKFADLPIAIAALLALMHVVDEDVRDWALLAWAFWANRDSPAATEAVGRYSRSVKGVAPASGHRKEMDRHQRELAKVSVDYSQHKEQCVVCQRGLGFSQYGIG